MKFLITGVAGLIGNHFSRYLLDQGYEVIGIDNFFGGYKDLVDKRVKLYEIDLLEIDKLNNIFIKEAPDIVYHFAAYAAEGLSPFIRNFNYNNNVICSINIVNCCIKYNIKKLIFTSSMAVYGNNNAPFNENQILYPIDPYGIAKFTVEQDIKQANEQFGLDYSIVRPHNIIGIYQNIWDMYRNVIGIWIKKCIDNKDILVYGDGEQVRAFSDIKFYLYPLYLLSQNFNGQIFNLGADTHFKLKDIALLVQKTGDEFLGRKVNIKFVEERHEVKIAYCDHSKAKELLGFVDMTNIQQTIVEMFEWAIHQPNRVSKKMNYEIQKNIYSYWK